MFGTELLFSDELSIERKESNRLNMRNERNDTIFRRSL